MTSGCHSDNGVSIMAFTVPTFDLLCDIYTGPFPARVLRIHDQPCNLAMGRRVQQAIPASFGLPEGYASPSLLVPAGTDVRDGACGPPGVDFIECPPGTGRWYFAGYVDDVGKGFPNEYRLVALGKCYEDLNAIEFAGLHWPIPIP